LEECIATDLCFCYEKYFKEVGAKTVPRNHVNRNIPNKNSDFMLIFAIESIENTIKNAIKVS